MAQEADAEVVLPRVRACLGVPPRKGATKHERIVRRAARVPVPRTAAAKARSGSAEVSSCRSKSGQEVISPAAKRPRTMDATSLSVKRVFRVTDIATVTKTSTRPWADRAPLLASATTCMSLASPRLITATMTPTKPETIATVLVPVVGRRLGGPTHLKDPLHVVMRGRPWPLLAKNSRA